ncbi:MAG: recombination mediator RecR [Gemmatimonadetes bacterium]|nr:recombination mediator RecR [Gemmatimonadota bacterium]
MSVIDTLTDEFTRLPGIGRKTAIRLVHHLLGNTRADPERLATALLEVAERVSPCPRCGNFTEEEVCKVCRDPRRDEGLICVVEKPYDVMAIERTGEYRGHYHVLGGRLSPMDGIGPEQLRVDELLDRIRGSVRGSEEKVDEVIIATAPDIAHDATTVYLEGVLRPLGVRVTRFASGLPVGSDLEYVDGATIARALSGRREST